MTATSRDLVSVAEVRAAGLTLAAAGDDAVQEAITLASVVVERICGQPFRPVQFPATLGGQPLVVDGTGRAELWLDVPIVAVTECGSIDTAGRMTAYDVTTWTAYTRSEFAGDDRGNPKVVRQGGSVWPAGRQNVYLKGTFGMVEPDPASGTVRAPLDVRRAVLLLVVNDYAWKLTDEDRQDERLRRFLVSESTEGHSYSLAATAASSGPTGLREVDRILQRYPRPRRVQARRDPSRPTIRG